MDIFDKIRLSDFNQVKLLEFGFQKEEDSYYLQKKIDLFEFRLTLSENKSNIYIWDLDFDEECASYTAPFVATLLEEFLLEIQTFCRYQIKADPLQGKRIFTYIEDHFKVQADYPFEEDFQSAVFRNQRTKKWFALMMNLPYKKFYPEKGGMVDAINLKTAHVLTYTKEFGIFEAYHMNKKHWVTILLDGTVSDDIIQEILSESYRFSEKK